MQNRIVLALLILLFGYLSVGCTPTKTNFNSSLIAVRVSQAPRIDAHIDSMWANAAPLSFMSDWRGRPTATRTSVRALWMPEGLYLLWELDGAGLHNTDHHYPINQQRDKLYEEDCVELFVAPNPAMPHQYAEIEAGPYGHFLDLWIDRNANLYNGDWSAGLSVAAQQDGSNRRVVIEMAVSAPTLAAALIAGARLPIGLYRIEGTQPRQYLAAFPTQTFRPNFHVPDAFGTLVLSP